MGVRHLRQAMHCRDCPRLCLCSESARNRLRGQPVSAHQKPEVMLRAECPSSLFAHQSRNGCLSRKCPVIQQCRSSRERFRGSGDCPVPGRNPSRPPAVASSPATAKPALHRPWWVSRNGSRNAVRWVWNRPSAMAKIHSYTNDIEKRALVKECLHLACGWTGDMLRKHFQSESEIVFNRAYRNRSPE